jgi:hypothetical protein
LPAFYSTQWLGEFGAVRVFFIKQERQISLHRQLCSSLYVVGLEQSSSTQKKYFY